MYDIHYDPATRILHFTVEGFWTLGTLAAFSAAVLAKGTAIRLRHGHYAILNDARRLPIQSPEVARGITLLRNKGLAITDGPIVTVVHSMLAKMQGERVIQGSNARVFLDMEEATDWLATVWPPAG